MRVLRGENETRLQQCYELRSDGASQASRWAASSSRDPARGEVEQPVEELPRERLALGGRLHLDEAPIRGHHDVHIGLGRESST